MTDPAEHFYYHHTPAGIAFMDARHKAVADEVKSFRREVLLSDAGQQMVKEKLAEAEQNYANAAANYAELQKTSALVPDDQDWFYNWLIELAEAKLKKQRSSLWKWRMLISPDDMDGMSPTNEQVDHGFNLEAIKEVPIDEVIGYAPTFRSDDRWFFKCPVHNEKTASFVWYRSQNTFHCFGCSENGDVITLYMKINNVDFQTACRQLSTS